MKSISPVPAYSLCALFAVATVSCDRSPKKDPEQIIIDRVETDLRKPAIPSEDGPAPAPEYPAEIPKAPSGELAARPAPGILESVLEGIVHQDGGATGTSVVEVYGPEILGAILEGNMEIPPEVIDEAQAALVKNAPAIIEEILNRSGEKDSVAASIGTLIFRMILGSGNDGPTPPRDKSHY